MAMIQIGDRVVLDWNDDVGTVIQDDPVNHRLYARFDSSGPAWIDYTSVKDNFKAPWPFNLVRRLLAYCW